LRPPHQSRQLSFSSHRRPDGGFQLRARRTPPTPGAPPAKVVLARGTPFAAIIPGDGVVEAVVTQGLSSFLNLYNSAIIARLVLTWFPNPPQAVVGPLSTVCDPYLNLFRGIIPPIGGTIDLSPILAFVVLDVFTNSAAALPCEVVAGVGAGAGGAGAVSGTAMPRVRALRMPRWARKEEASGAGAEEMTRSG